ncbi:DUF4169 family protein [Amaricoccus sp.]|uniref:DUF4169 family protein n=1 Tax=Amaricoccus sp. TaxID=1872485 RepID=UPI00262917C9|nr:DUF4169 family protein [uncultured Amaricoccus sp.]
MSEVVSLRQARKRAERATARREADANAAKHGLSKGERRRQKAEREKAGAHLDGHRRETED